MQAAIDRKALVYRNNPNVNAFDSLASLSVGNGEFALLSICFVVKYQLPQELKTNLYSSIKTERSDEVATGR